MRHLRTKRNRPLVALAVLAFSALLAATQPAFASPPSTVGEPVVDEELPETWADPDMFGIQADTPITCDGDGVSGRRVQLLYVRGDGQADRLEQLRSTFQSHARNINGRFVQTSDALGGHREVRFVHDSSCTPTITRVVIPQADIADGGRARDAVDRAGYNRTDRKYVVWTENDVCGLGWGGQGDRTPGDANLNNHRSGWAMVGLGRCFANPDTDVHELLHTMGAVNPAAPYATAGSHCYIYGDLMCYNDQTIPSPPGRMIDCPNPGDGWIDCNHDSYFNPNPRPDGWLINNWNIADSLFLLKGGGTQLPLNNVLLTNKANGYVADVDGAATGNGTKVKLEGEHSHPAQRWNLTPLGDGRYRITPVIATDKALDANLDRGRVVDGTSYFTQIWSYGGGDNQKWTLRPVGGGAYEIVAHDTGCLTGENLGAALGYWVCTGSDTQRWTITA